MKTKENQNEKSFQPQPVKKVLIAMDYNANAQTIAEQGYALAKNLNAETVLLHVLVDDSNYTELDYNPVIGYGDFSHVYFHGMIDKEGLLTAAHYFLNKITEHLGNTKLQTIVVEGDPADSVIKTAADVGAEIIIIGSHSRRWLEQIVTGRVTERVLRRASVPVFIIPTGKGSRVM